MDPDPGGPRKCGSCRFGPAPDPDPQHCFAHADYTRQTLYPPPPTPPNPPRPGRCPRVKGMTGLVPVDASYCTGGGGEGEGNYHAADVSVECDVVEVVAGGGHLPRVLLAPVTLSEHFLLPARSRDQLN
jgi:hypothetical protein